MTDSQLPVTDMRVARPSTDIAKSLQFYVEALGLERLGGFENHSGYDGVFIGLKGAQWHIELTRHTSGLPHPSPTNEDLLVLYLARPNLQETIARLIEFGYSVVEHANPYWGSAGAAIFSDPDGYLLVLCPE